MIRTTLNSTGLLIVSVALALAGCASLSPYRYLTPEQSVGCPGGSVPANAPCLHVTPERTAAYELHFVEFDDQGWQFPPAEPGAEGKAPLGSASRQIEAVTQALKRATDAGEGVNVVVYVHGWKHNAAYDDGDVGKFRRILSGVHAQEIANRDGGSTKPRKVVGIYVGWRGKSLTLGSLVDNVTFWDRKAAALRVAQGSARELFARLTAFQRSIDDAPDGCPTSEDGEYRHCRVRMLLIGHSFGAWVLYSAISESLIQAVTRGVSTNPAKDGAMRYGDMVVLLNPAFEASRYIPLRNAARLPAGASIARYQAPILVVITSRADWATRYAFPAGRLISTVLQRPTSSSEQGKSIGHTPGHMDGLITHELIAIDDKEAAACAGWQVPDDKAVPEEQHATIERNYDIEERNERAFFGRYENAQGLPVLKPGWQRIFCGGTKLVHLDSKWAMADPNVSIWNVRTYRDVIRDHNDITGSRLSSFVSQLYHDVTANPRVRDQTRRDGDNTVAGGAAPR